MSSLASPSSSTQPRDLSIYQNFVRGAAQDDDVVLNVDKATATVSGQAVTSGFQKLYRWLFGQNKSAIVEDFSAALEAKYGKDVANFAFSDDKKQQALNAGLSKSVIKQVIENASFACSAQDDIKAYARMADMNIQIAQQVSPKIEKKITSFRQKFQKVQDFANRQLSEFKDIAELKAALEDAITVATTSREIIKQIAKNESQQQVQKDSLREAQPDGEERAKRRPSISPTTVAIAMEADDAPVKAEQFSIADDTEIEDSYTVWRDVPGVPMTEEALQAALNTTRPQHEKVLSQLNERFKTNPKDLAARLERLSMIAVHAIQQAGSQLAVFANHVNADPSACFHLDIHGSVVVRPPSAANPASQLTAEENQKIWHLLCHTLETCYGKPLLQRMIPEEKRQELFSSSLTAGHLNQLFNDIKGALEADRDFLKSQLFIVDDKYCDGLSTNPQFSQEALEAEQQLASHGTYSIQLARKLFDIGVLSAGYHAGGLVAGGTGTAVAAVTGITLPIIPLTLVASALCSFLAGKIVGSRISTDVGSFTANRAAAYTIGSTSTEIATTPLLHSLGDHLAHTLVGPAGAAAITFLTDYGLDTGGAIVADYLRHACVGSVINGIDIENLPSPPNVIPPAQAADMEVRIVDLLQTIINAADQLSPPCSPQWERTRVRL